MITSSRVVQRVADDLARKNLEFFEDYGAGLSRQKADAKAVTDEPAAVLKQAISNGVIQAAAVENTELIKVTMRSTNPQEARQIVDSFVSNYMAVEVAAAAGREDQKLAVLDDERKTLAVKLQRRREAMRQLAQEYGTTTLGGRQEAMLRRVTALLGELTQIEARRIQLESQVQSLEQGGSESPVRAEQEFQSEREHYINSDASVQALARRIADIEVDSAVAEVEESAESPAVKQKAKALDLLKSRLQKRKQELSKAFDRMAAERHAEALAQNLLKAKAELEQIKAYEERLRVVLAKEDSQAIEFGRKGLAIQELQFQLDLDREMYDTISRRIKELEMERKRPARVSVAYNADIASVQSFGGRRFKAAIAVLVSALVCSVLLAIITAQSGRKSSTPAG